MKPCNVFPRCSFPLLKGERAFQKAILPFVPLSSQLDGALHVGYKRNAAAFLHSLMTTITCQDRSSYSRANSGSDLNCILVFVFVIGVSLKYVNRFRVHQALLSLCNLNRN